MSKWLKLGTLAAVLAVVGLAALGTVALAQGPMPQSGTPMFGPGYGMGMGMAGHMGGAQNSLVAVAAKVIGIDQTALVTTLNDGKTIADVAKEKGVSTSKIVDEFLAPREQALKSAVDAKRITQAQADTMVATMKTNIAEQLSSKWSPRGLGTGFMDANDDGVCDNYGTNHPAGMMGGIGMGAGWSR